MEIPGYKWDPEKRRYFKILSTGELPGGEYTISRVAEKDRESRRSIVRDRAQTLAEDSLHADSSFACSSQAEWEFGRLGVTSRQIYVGSADELISAVHVTQKNELVTGSRTGVIAFNGTKSGPGRSVVGISEVGGALAVAAVDNEAGSTVATPFASVHLVQEFATSLSPVDQLLAIGSQRGVNIWDVSQADTLDVLPLGSVTALTNCGPQTLLAGTKSGDLEVVDLRTYESKTANLIESRRSITNLGFFDGSIVATGLEDEMWLYDLRDLDEPVLQFGGYENWSTAKHGFAIRDSAVAVAMDNGEVRVFDGTTGHSLGQACPPSSRGPISALAWTQDGLYIAEDNVVVLKPGSRRDPGIATPGMVGRIHRALNLI